MLNFVPKIRPITDLKKTSEISEFCHRVGEPVIITKNGYSDLVIMSVETFEREMFRREVYLKLAEADAEFLSGAEAVSDSEVVQNMRNKINGKN